MQKKNPTDNLGQNKSGPLLIQCRVDALRNGRIGQVELRKPVFRENAPCDCASAV